MSVIRLFFPAGWFYLLCAVMSRGVNLLTLLAFSAQRYSQKTALIDQGMKISYQELYRDSLALKCMLNERYQIKKGKRVALIGRNSKEMVKSIFAVSGTGADLYLLHADAGEALLHQFIHEHAFDLVLYDSSILKVDRGQSLALSGVQDLMMKSDIHKKSPRSSAGRIILLTGGTTGKPKQITHQPSVVNFLPPFFTMIKRLKLFDYKTAYIPTPLYHGYGFAILLLFIALGKKIVISGKFHAREACKLIEKYKVDFIPVVPLMIDRMIKEEVASLRSLRCIASGSAELRPELAEEVVSRLGPVLYNLYGTSEAGLNLIATPADLKYSSKTVGRTIPGSNIKVVNENQDEVLPGESGQLLIINNWSMKSADEWIETGDIGYVDHNGYYYLQGRKDDMIVSGGINVYPAELKDILQRHPSILESEVMGMADDEYGQRLAAWVILKQDKDETEQKLMEWIRTKAARYQVPKEIKIIHAFPYTPIGKVDRAALKKIIP
ncbi:AMP-binding protein [Jeotgalibacillus sp. R-1-5s-1]|uniref:AMP-binding protein n=1 Tax=Jeotgalibacillus sp. R-1-5s-1 TaxID=2555897 RepID=UPI00106CCC9E|nr:AMP-binding protein [Jeotgalibacillus sp. R-1-5s-1]TFD95851.1 AMP-dependent synthetase [Jeotgalibacillus sp. R-1-5s-1]